MANFRDNARIIPFFPKDDYIAAAIKHKKTDNLNKLLKNAELDQQILDRYMVLANQNFEPEIFSAILKAGANPNINNGSLIYSAFGEDTPEKLEILLSHNADININNGKLATRAIEMDCEIDSYTGKRGMFLDSLLKFGIKLEGTNNAALKTAIEYKDIHSFKKLIAHGATNSKNNNENNITALELAEKGNFKEGADILKSYIQIEKSRIARKKQEKSEKRKALRNKFHKRINAKKASNINGNKP